LARDTDLWRGLKRVSQISKDFLLHCFRFSTPKQFRPTKYTMPFCYEPYAIFSDTRDLDFSLCFQEAILAPLVCIFMYISLLHYCWMARKDAFTFLFQKSLAANIQRLVSIMSSNSMLYYIQMVRINWFIISKWYLLID
jgi:hypothetical protein